MTRAAVSATLLVALFSLVLGQGEKPAPKLELKDVEGRALRLRAFLKSPHHSGTLEE
jgi:hypothetical protein